MRVSSGGERDLAVALHRMAVARIDERAGLPDRKVEGRAFGELAEIEIARMRPGRDRAGNTRGLTAGNSRPAAPRPRVPWNGFSGTVILGMNLPGHGAQVEVHVLDLPLRDNPAAANRYRASPGCCNTAPHS